MVSVIEMAEARVLFDSAVRRFILEGFSATPKAGYADADGLMGYLQDAVARQHAGIIFAGDGARLLGFVVVELPNRVRDHGWVSHLYAKSPEARRRLCSAALLWFRRRGVTTMRAANFSGASDEGFIRMFGRDVDAKVVSSIVEFRG